MMNLYQLLTPATVRVGLAAATKEDLINDLVDLLEGQPAVKGLEPIRQAVFARELQMSTGVGKGLALPHAKTAAVRDTVAAFAVTDEPVDYGAIDNQPVRLAFLLVGTEEARSQHIKLLSRVSRLMNRDPFRQRLLQARTPEDVIRAFEEGEASLLDV